MSTIVHGRRERRKQMTRSQLLVAGRKLFGEKGLYDSRIEDLTRVAGIAKGTLYGYFADKEALIRAVVNAGFDDLLAHVRRSAVGTRDGEERARAIIRAHIEFFAANQDLMRVFHQVRGMLTFHRPEWRGLRDALERYINELARILAVMPGRRRARSGPRVEPALLLFGAVSGVTSVRAALDVDLAKPAAVASTIAALVGMLSASPGSKDARPRPFPKPAGRGSRS